MDPPATDNMRGKCARRGAAIAGAVKAQTDSVAAKTTSAAKPHRASISLYIFARASAGPSLDPRQEAVRLSGSWILGFLGCGGMTRKMRQLALLLIGVKLAETFRPGLVPAFPSRSRLCRRAQMPARDGHFSQGLTMTLAESKEDFLAAARAGPKNGVRASPEERAIIEGKLAALCEYNPTEVRGGKRERRERTGVRGGPQETRVMQTRKCTGGSC